MGNKVYVDNGTELCKMVHFVCGSHLNKKRTLEKETHKRREGWLHTWIGLDGEQETRAPPRAPGLHPDVPLSLPTELL